MLRSFVMGSDWFIGQYKVSSKLGQGGMGEVWRGTDTKLNREVAIKILPEPLAHDPDRLARFAREARVLASLNHPNIATIHGVEENALVMELVPGKTLRERIAAGPIPLEEALSIARQIAGALEAAHEKGVVHRDLKPANIKITPDGRVKVLDFGLAKALSAEPSTADPNSSPTLTMRATESGVIMGTAAYMSPEQARGQTIDKRADIWAFGVVLYEMLVGRQLFCAPTVSDTLASVLRQEVDWSAIPRPVQRLLRLCLARDARERLCDMGDARLLMKELDLADQAGPPRRAAIPWTAAGVISIIAVVVSAIHLREMPPKAATVRFEIPMPEDTYSINGQAFAISPNGRQIAFVAARADNSSPLWVRDLDALTARSLPGTEGAVLPFWSPDSRFIGFWAAGKLRKVDAAGGLPQTLCELRSTALGGAWSRDGVILFGSSQTGQGIYRVAEAGGPIAKLTTPDGSAGEAIHAFPQILPDGRHLIYTAVGPQAHSVYLASMDGRGKKRLLEGIATHTAYAPPAAKGEPGRLLFLREGALMAQPVDAGTFDLAGDAVPVAGRVGSYLAFGYFSVSANDILVYRTGSGAVAVAQLTWFDRQGRPTGTVGPPAAYHQLALSPDGSRVAERRFDPQSSNFDIWVLDLARDLPTRFTFHPAVESYPVWSSDGKRVVFASNREGAGDIYQKDSSGSRPEEVLLKSALEKRPYDLSPDGRYLLYGVVDPQTKNDLWVLPLGANGAADGEPEPFLRTQFNETQGQWAPGPAGTTRWVAYASDESGQSEVYVQSFPTGAGKFLISNGGGAQPRWRADGKELFYITPDGKLIAVDIERAPQFQVGIPHSLFTTRISGGGGSSDTQVFRYAVIPDGKRFLIDRDLEGAQKRPSNLTVILNWTAGLKR